MSVWKVVTIKREGEPFKESRVTILRDLTCDVGTQEDTLMLFGGESAAAPPPSFGGPYTECVQSRSASWMVLLVLEHR